VTTRALPGGGAERGKSEQRRETFSGLGDGALRAVASKAFCGSIIWGGAARGRFAPASCRGRNAIDRPGAETARANWTIVGAMVARGSRILLPPRWGGPKLLPPQITCRSSKRFAKNGTPAPALVRFTPRKLGCRCVRAYLAPEVGARDLGGPRASSPGAGGAGGEARTSSPAVIASPRKLGPSPSGQAFPATGSEPTCRDRREGSAAVEPARTPVHPHDWLFPGRDRIHGDIWNTIGLRGNRPQDQIFGRGIWFVPEDSFRSTSCRGPRHEKAARRRASLRFQQPRVCICRGLAGVALGIAPRGSNRSPHFIESCPRGQRSRAGGPQHARNKQICE